MGKPKSAAADWAQSHSRLGKGRLYVRFAVVVAVIAVAIYAHLAIASVPTAAQSIANASGTGVNGVQIANTANEEVEL